MTSGTPAAGQGTADRNTPRTSGPARYQEATPQWIAEHRAQWGRKASLRLVYRRWFQRVRDLCVPGVSIVEIGCGPGFFKDFYPDVLSTDVIPNPYADRVASGEALPFPDGTIGNLVLVDVFHHLLHPDRFLQEAERTLAPRGRLVMLEPWLGFAGRLLWRYLHHECCDPRVDPTAPWGGTNKDPMEGNSALPYLYFKSGGRMDRLNLPLRVLRRECFCALPWLLTGGFQETNLLPPTLVPAVEILDRILSRAPRLTATRCLVVVEKEPGDVECGLAGAP